MHRFFATIKNGEVILGEVDAFHLFSVLRVRQGEHLEIVHDRTLFEAEVVSLTPLKIHVLHELPDNHVLPLAVTLFMCITKKDKPDLVIERATEMGAQEIVLVDADRSVVKNDEEQLIKKLVRYQRIIKSAAMQSKRIDFPEITTLPFKAIATYKQFDHLLIGVVQKDTGVLSAFPPFQKGDRVGIIIGPEGGFSKEEMVYAKEHHFQPLNFSSHVLRSEVASISALAIINYLGNLL